MPPKQPYKKASLLSIDHTLGKIPPQAVDLEEAVLGALILENNAYTQICDILTPEKFYKEVHQKIFAAIKVLADNKFPFDLLSLTEQLRKNGVLEEIGGPYFITQLSSKISNASHIDFHARIIEQKFIQREFIRISGEIQQKAYDDDIDIDDLIDFSQDSVTKIIEDSNARDSIISSLDAARVTAEEEIKDGEVIFCVREADELIPVLTKGNISTITGKAKSRKTFLLTMVAAVVICGQLFNKIFGRSGSRVAYFDTEQGRKRTQKILHRILKLIGKSTEPLIEVFSLRAFSPEERVKLIDAYLSKNPVDFVVIDGIRDLITDINDPEQATLISTRLMKWSEIYDCHICTVLHQNKADTNARGHVGTEMVNKSETVLSVSKVKNSEFTTVECENMRGLEFESFQFYVDEHGIPRMEDAELVEEVTKSDVPF